MVAALAVQTLLFPMTSERAHLLVARYGLKAQPRRERRVCGNSCCRGDKPKGHGPYWFVAGKYVGSKDLLTRLMSELVVAREMVEAEREATVLCMPVVKTTAQNADGVGEGTRRRPVPQRSQGRVAAGGRSKRS